MIKGVVMFRHCRYAQGLGQFTFQSNIFHKLVISHHEDCTKKCFSHDLLALQTIQNVLLFYFNTASLVSSTNHFDTPSQDGANIVSCPSSPLSPLQPLLRPRPSFSAASKLALEEISDFTTSTWPFSAPM